MEPVFMILGQSAATAAVMAIDEGIAVQEVNYAALRERLVADGQVLDPQGDPHPAADISPASLPGVVVDDPQATFVGDWPAGSSIGPWVGSGYRHDGNVDQGTKSARFEAKLPPCGGGEPRRRRSAEGTGGRSGVRVAG
jgi:hypothetical protein